MNRHVDVREIAGMTACAVLSLVALLALLVLVEGGGRQPAILALIIALACPVVWCLVLLPARRGDGPAGSATHSLIRGEHKWPKRIGTHVDR
jgi:hypothetical protein